MAAVKLTDQAVAALVCPAGRKDALFFDTTPKGFGLRVTAGGARVFLLQYRVGTKVRRHIIGEWPNITTAQARKLAEAARGTVRSGGDPVASRRAEHAATLAAEAKRKAEQAEAAFTVDALIRQWERGHLVERRPSYRQEAPRRIRAALGEWRDVPVMAFTRAAAVQVLDRVKADDGPIAANRVYAYARACFGWALKRGSVTENPFDAVPKPSQEQARERVLADDELGRIWRACAKVGEPWASILSLLVVTGQRRGEVAGMRWSELALGPEGREVWTLPGPRTKNGRPHDVPLAPPALALIRACPRIEGCDLLFSQGRRSAPSGFGKAKDRLDAKVLEDGEGAMPAWTLHDLRRTAATGLQRLGVRLEVTEAALNHVSGSRAGIVGVYQRHAWTEEKRAALNAWAAHVLRVAEGREQAGSVVAMAGRRA